MFGFLQAICDMTLVVRTVEALPIPAVRKGNAGAEEVEAVEIQKVIHLILAAVVVAVLKLVTDRTADSLVLIGNRGCDEGVACQHAKGLSKGADLGSFRMLRPAVSRRFCC
jgi:hypothetical protein